MTNQNISMGGTASMTAGNLDNRNIGSIVSFSDGDEWVMVSLAGLIRGEDGVSLFAQHMPNEEWSLDDDEPVYVTQPLAERFLYNIRESLKQSPAGKES